MALKAAWAARSLPSVQRVSPEIASFLIESYKTALFDYLDSDADDADALAAKNLAQARLYAALTGSQT